MERLVAALRSAHATYPSLRVGQLLVDAISESWGERDAANRLYHLTDREIAEAVEAFLRKPVTRG